MQRTASRTTAVSQTPAVKPPAIGEWNVQPFGHSAHTWSTYIYCISPRESVSRKRETCIPIVRRLVARQSWIMPGKAYLHTCAFSCLFTRCPWNCEIHMYLSPSSHWPGRMEMVEVFESSCFPILLYTVLYIIHTLEQPRQDNPIPWLT